ncbi:MAG: C25 family cysteine peptidase, partial [Candidatus Caldipriscus sp.]
MILIFGVFTVRFEELENLPKFAEYSGFPLIPYKVLVINLGEDEKVSGIRIKSIKQREISYKLDFALPVDTPGSQTPKTYLPQTYPKEIVFVGNQGFFRGNRLAFIIVSAIHIRNGRTYLNEEVSFEIIKSKENLRFSRPKYSDDRIWGGTFKLLGISKYQTSSFLPQDRVDLAIITSENLKPHWKNLADFKNSVGIRTEIYTVEWISSNFPGNSIPTKIRNFLKYLYENFGLSALLIGADPQEVPPLRTNVPLFYDTLSGYGSSFRDFLLTDFYYSALDGEWNTNGDRWDGGWGDTLDLIPDILVGRIPFSSPENVINYVNSLIDYETRRNFDSPNFVFFGSNLFGDTANPDSADGCMIALYIS